MRRIIWWTKQLIPRTYWAVQGPAEGYESKRFVIWRMWLGRCYDVTEIAA